MRLSKVASPSLAIATAPRKPKTRSMVLKTTRPTPIARTAIAILILGAHSQNVILGALQVAGIAGIAGLARTLPAGVLTRMPSRKDAGIFASGGPSLPAGLRHQCSSHASGAGSPQNNFVPEPRSHHCRLARRWRKPSGNHSDHKQRGQPFLSCLGEARAIRFTIGRRWQVKSGLTSWPTARIRPALRAYGPPPTPRQVSSRF